MTHIMDPTTAAVPTLTQATEHITVQVGQMAPGGHCVAQHDGRAVFVRHAIPGETVVAKLTGEGPSGRFLLADTVEVLNASEFRRAHHWKLADSQRAYAAGRQPIGGAEYGHIVLEYQRRLKANVLRDTMVRLGGQRLEDMEISVAGIEEDGSAGLDWRTRNTFLVSPAGRLCLPVHRSLKTVSVRNVPTAVPELDALGLWHYDFSGAARVAVATPAHGRDVLISITPEPHVATSEVTLQQHLDAWRRELSDLPAHVSVAVAKPSKHRGARNTVIPVRGRGWVHEEVTSQTYGTQSFRVSSQRTWPAHRDGPATLVDAVLSAAAVQTGQVVVDLYAGSGLYTRFLAEAVGPHGTVVAVEPGAVASHDAKVNLQNVPQATVVHSNVNRAMSDWIRTPQHELVTGGLNGGRVDTVVLNAPRRGARRATLSRIQQLQPDKIVYISNHPPSLARDTGWLDEHGWVLASVEAYDLAPNTHQMETICVFTRS